MRHPKQLLAKAKQCEVIPTGEGYQVFSPSGKDYFVQLTPDYCECQWAQYKQTPCSHILAVHSYLEALRGRTVSAWPTLTDAKRQKHPRIWLEPDLHLTSKRNNRLPVAKPYKPDTVWVKAQMIADYPQAGYEKSKQVFLRMGTANNDRWTVFSGKMNEYPIELDTADAKKYLRTIRDGLGRLLMADRIQSIEALYLETIT